MGLVLERVQTDGLAQLSYIIGDNAAGVGAVIDPRRDVDVYLSTLRDRRLRLAHIIETHIHADFVSGAHELTTRTGADIAGGDGDYAFKLRRLREGDRIGLGGVSLHVLHTPGHTPEHVSLLAFDSNQGDQPFGVFTGDTLFNMDVGRPDLMGHGTDKKLAADLHHSLFRKLLPLGDRIEVFPCHGAGSACGKSIGDRLQSTIGNERLFNPALQDRSQSEFVTWLLSGMPEPPAHYARLKNLNAAGAPIRGGVPPVPPLPPAELQRRQAGGTTILDCRSILAFGGGHIPGALNVALRPEFPTWAGRVLDPETGVAVVVEHVRDLEAVAAHLFRIGIDKVEGYLHDGMTSWQNAGLALARTPQWTVHELEARRRDDDVLVLDVRSEEEWQRGHVPGARHIFVPHLERQAGRLARDKCIVTYCGTGYRASIAASLLQRHGFEHVANVPGSWTAWKAAGLPVEN
ncbi:MBL fold metallo-hydrolase [Bradyrhizobium sp. ARR65]|uniref:MBL fold metallo-hydrolase n=1 Tax=Bradyrhizobium sp. ARR65 TaxID=1040989 RepID=UPI000465E7B3